MFFLNYNAANGLRVHCGSANVNPCMCCFAVKIGEDKQDLLQRLIEAEYADGSQLDDNEITGLIIATLFAGQHTTNVTLTWVCDPNVVSTDSALLT